MQNAQGISDKVAIMTEICPLCKKNPSMWGLKGRACFECAKDRGRASAYRLMGRVSDWADKEAKKREKSHSR